MQKKVKLEKFAKVSFTKVSLNEVFVHLVLDDQWSGYSCIKHLVSQSGVIQNFQ